MWLVTSHSKIIWLLLCVLCFTFEARFIAFYCFRKLESAVYQLAFIFYIRWLYIVVLGLSRMHLIKTCFLLMTFYCFINIESLVQRLSNAFVYQSCWLNYIEDTPPQKDIKGDVRPSLCMWTKYVNISWIELLMPKTHKNFQKILKPLNMRFNMLFCKQIVHTNTKQCIF